MTCARCGQQSARGAGSCAACGEPFSPRCAHCGGGLPGGARFCSHCGQAVAKGGEREARDPLSYTPRHLAERILRSRSALEGERKRVTVLFADVKGSMELAERVDPEVLHGIMDRFFGILAEGVHRFEGTVNQYTGDGIMALFGAPIAHEDHAQRACHAALRLRDELRRCSEELRRTHGLGFDVRMGLNSGEVVVGKIGDDLRMDYTAQGRTVGVAARIEQLAYPGTVYVAEETERLARGFFRFRDLGEFQLKGARDPVGVFELEGIGTARTRLDLARARGLSRFVGRDSELAALDAGLEQASAGSGRVVGIIGEGGIGKSRLCAEFLDGCRGRSLTILEAHGLPHGRGLPFLPILELLRNFFGITERDNEEACREKIAGRTLLLDDSLRDALPLLFDFLGVGMADRAAHPADPEARQRRLYRVVTGLLRARGSREPTVVLLDDLHWLDRGSDAFLAEVLQGVPASRALWVVNFRPPYRAPWMDASFYGQIDLAPLGPDAIQELLDALLGRDPSLDGLGEQIAERAAGNPFFVEEIVRSLVEGGSLQGTPGAYRQVRRVDAASIPERVQSVLAARIDRLPDREKHVLLTAAVIGRRFPEGVLRRVLGVAGDELEAPLSSLAEAGFLHPVPSDVEGHFAFAHPLTQEVAYAAQLGEARSRVHGAVADAIQSLYADRLDEHAALLSHHYKGAQRLLDAAQWNRRAALWAGCSGFSESLSRWREVGDLCRMVPPSAEADSLRLESCVAILDLAWRGAATEKELEETFREGTELAQRLSQTSALAILHATYGVGRGLLFADVQAYADHTARATEIAEQLQDDALLRDVLTARILALEVTGSLKEAVTASNLVLDTGDEGAEGTLPSRFATSIFLRIRRGHLWCSLGRLEEAERDLARGLDLARRRNDPEMIYLAYASRVYADLARGDRVEVLADARRSLDVAEKLDMPGIRRGVQQTLGIAHLLRGEWEEAVEAIDGALSTRQERGFYRIDEGASLALLALARTEIGEVERARRAAEEAVAISRQRGTRFLELLGWLALGWVIARGEGRRGASELTTVLERAAELVRLTAAAALEPLIHVERAEMARHLGEAETRERELREARRLLLEMGASGHAERVAAWMASPPG